MAKGNIIIYWAFIILLQTALLIRKVVNDEFFVWNIVAFIGAAVFIFFRLKRDKPIVAAEMTLAAFIGINGFFTGLAQVIRLDDILVLVLSLPISFLSLFMTYYIWKTSQREELS